MHFLAGVVFSCLAAGFQVPLFKGLMSSTSKSGELQQKLRDVLPRVEAIQQIGGTVGISIGVIRHGSVVLEHNFGFADLEKQLVANSSTLYPLGSLTKAFVSATVAQLVHDGLLQWDAPINTYIPELLFQSDATLAKRLTLIDLLSHQTGLLRLDALWLGANNEVNFSKNFTIPVCNHLSSAYPLRSQWLYNNFMYALAGEIIERATNLPWGEVLASRVLDKVGLSQTTVIESKIPKDTTALPYIISDDKRPIRTGDLGLMGGSLMSSAGGVRSTVRDLLTWGDALLSIFGDEQTPIELVDVILSGHSFMNKTAISDELYSLGFAKVITPTQFGKMGFNPGLIDGMPTLGTDSEPQRVFYHNGAIPGYNHCIMLIPGHQVAIVVLTNSIAQGDIADWVAQTLLQAVLDIKSLDVTSTAEQAASKWRKTYETIATTLEKERIPDTPEAPHEDFIGSYEHETGALSLQVFEREGALKFSINGKPSQTHALSHYHHNNFIFLPSAEERSRRGLFHYGTPAWLLHFERNCQGEVDRIVWNIDSLAPKGEVFTKSKEREH